MQRDDVKFEQMISFRPKLEDGLIAEPEPTLRDMVFDYYCGKLNDIDKATVATEQYIGVIYDKFGSFRGAV